MLVSADWTDGQFSTHRIETYPGGSPVRGDSTAIGRDHRSTLAENCGDQREEKILLLTTKTVTSFEFPPFLNLLKEQMWYQPWTTGLKYPEVKGLEVGVEHTPVAW